MADPASPPGLSEADLRFYAEEFARTGARGGLSWYRNVGPNWELLAPFAGLRVEVPALYLAGDRDLVLAFRGMDRLAAGLHASAPACARRSCCPAAAIGPSRSGPRRSTPP